MLENYLIYDESDTRWVWVNPMDGEVDVPTPESDNRVIYKIGLDSWDIGITDFDSLKETFIKFRTYWEENKNV